MQMTTRVLIVSLFVTLVGCSLRARAFLPRSGLYAYKQEIHDTAGLQTNMIRDRVVTDERAGVCAIIREQPVDGGTPYASEDAFEARVERIERAAKREVDVLMIDPNTGALMGSGPSPVTLLPPEPALGVVWTDDTPDKYCRIQNRISSRTDDSVSVTLEVVCMGVAKVVATEVWQLGKGNTYTSSGDGGIVLQLVPDQPALR